MKKTVLTTGKILSPSLTRAGSPSGWAGTSGSWELG